jgi:hypothetical protein
MSYVRNQQSLSKIFRDRQYFDGYQGGKQCCRIGVDLPVNPSAQKVTKYNLMIFMKKLKSNKRLADALIAGTVFAVSAGPERYAAKRSASRSKTLGLFR